MHDLRFAWRRLRRSPGFAAAATLTLALGIGANIVVFGFLNALVLRPLPVDRPEELVFLNSGPNGTTPNFSYPNYRDLRDRNDVFAGLVAYRLTVFSLAAGGRTDRMWGYLVTGNYFDTLGIRATRGRLFSPDDDRTPGGHPLVVLSYGSWQRRFGGAPDIVGTVVTINRQPFTVVGVAPPGFRGTETIFAPELWIPMAMQAQIEIGNPWLESRMASNTWVLGRLEPNVTRAQAETALSTIAGQLAREYPHINEGMRIRVAQPGVLGRTLRGTILGFGSVLLAAAGLVLLIACVNLANLLLARGTDRRREIAMYVALGAGSTRVVRQLVIEAALLASIGGALAIGLAAVIARLLSAWRPPLDVPFSIAMGIDGRVLGVAAALTVGATLGAGLLPAWRSSRFDLVTALKNDRGSRSTRRWELRDLLVAGQTALSTIVLVVAVLTTRGLLAALEVPIGYNPDGAVSVSFDLRFHGYDQQRGRAFQRQLLERLRAEPGLESVALTNSIPLSIDTSTNVIYIEGEPAPPASRVPHAILYRPSDGYFRTMQTPIVEGREFTERDVPGTQAVAIVNQTFVHQILGDRRALDARIKFGVNADALTIVGVAEDGKYASLGEAPTPVVFRPLAQAYNATTIVVARSPLPAAEALASLRRVILDLDGSLGLYDAGALTDQLRLPLLPAKIAAGGIGALGLLTLVLAITGVYGVLSYAVARRTREIGVRVAIGATRWDVLRLVFGRTLLLLGAGAGVGVIAAGAASRLLGPYLYGASPRDPWMFAAIAATMLAAAALASWVPARRATTVDPMAALRAE